MGEVGYESEERFFPQVLLHVSSYHGDADLTSFESRISMVSLMTGMQDI